jgi:hypothetical protein
MACDGGGIKALSPKRTGGRQRETTTDTLTTEKALVARIAKAAGPGEMLNITRSQGGL